MAGPELFKIDPQNPQEGIAKLRELFRAGGNETKGLFEDHFEDVLERLANKRNGRLGGILGRFAPVGARGLSSKRSRSGRNYGSFGNVLATATTINTITIITAQDLDDLRLFFSDPTGILLSMTALKVGGTTVDMNLATSISVGSGATTGTAGADLASYRSQVLDFDPFEHGFPLGNVKTSTAITFSLLTNFTAGTPYLGFGFNTKSAVSSAKLFIDEDCACN